MNSFTKHFYILHIVQKEILKENIYITVYTQKKINKTHTKQIYVYKLFDRLLHVLDVDDNHGVQHNPDLSI